MLTNISTFIICMVVSGHMFYKDICTKYGIEETLEHGGYQPYLVIPVKIIIKLYIYLKFFYFICLNPLFRKTY